MNVWDRIGQLLWPRQGYRAVAEVSQVGRPSYASQYSASAVLPREMTFKLLTQFRRNIPALPRAIDILSGFAGAPEFVSGNEVLAADLNAWADRVQFGHVGQGLGAWLRDHLGQALVYGFAVGEAQVSAGRNDVERLWSYLSPGMGFRSNPAGEIEVVQQQRSELVVLPAERIAVTTHSPSATNPQGESLFLALPMVCEIWLDVLHAFRATWRRSGIPTFHVNWEPPEGLNDPEGTMSAQVVANMESRWNEAIRSQVMDGRAKDFYSSGRVKVLAIGADAVVMDIQVAKRQIVEEILVATGIPPWLLGYSWSTTERLSAQRADMMVATVEALRREVEPGIRKLVDLRQRLAARRGEWDLIWPDVNLQDAKEAAMARFWDSRGMLSRQQYALGNWSAGIWDQAQAAEYLTGSGEVAQPMETPPVVPTGGQGALAAQIAPEEIEESAEREARAEYPELWARHDRECEGAHAR